MTSISNDSDIQSQSSRKPSHVQRRTTSIMEETSANDEGTMVEFDKTHHPSLPHFKAMMYRKWISIKRSWVNVLVNIIVTIIVSSHAIIVKVLMDTLAKDTLNTYNFNTYVHKSDYVVIVGNPENEIHKKYIDVTHDIFVSDTGREPKLKIFPDTESANKWIYSCKTQINQKQNL